MDHAKESGLVKNAGFWTGIVLLIFASIVFLAILLSEILHGFRTWSRYVSQMAERHSDHYFYRLYLAIGKKKKCSNLKIFFPKGRELGNILSVLASVVVFMLIVNFTGFIIASTVLLFILLVREYKWYSGLAISAVTSIILFIVFKSFFDIPLPVNMFGW